MSWDESDPTRSSHVKILLNTCCIPLDPKGWLRFGAQRARGWEDARQRRAPRRQRPVMQKRRRPDEQTQQTNEKNGVETRVLSATAERGTRAIRAPRNTANATQHTYASQRQRVEGPKSRARKARRTQQHANETRHATARTGRKSGTQRMKHSAGTQPERSGRAPCARTTPTRSK